MIARPAIADYPAGAHLATREIDDLELVWMLHGRARVSGPDGDLPLGPGRLLLIPPALPHSFAWDTARPSRHGYVHFDRGVLGRDPPAQIGLWPMTALDPLAGLCAYLLWLGQLDQDDWQRRTHETLRFLLSVLADGPLPTTAARDDPPPALTAAVDHLRAAWAQMPLRRVTVAELAGAGLVSRGYLGRLFRATFSLSPGPAMEHVRCSRAETLLVRTDLPVETIARHCGFADSSHFSHRFTALHDESPRAYRASGGRVSVLDHAGVRRLARLVWGPN